MAAEPKPQRDVTEIVLAALAKACAKHHRAIDWLTVNALRGPSDAEDLRLGGAKVHVLTINCGRAANPEIQDLAAHLIQTTQLLMSVDPRVVWVQAPVGYPVQLLIPAEWGSPQLNITLEYAHEVALCLRRATQQRKMRETARCEIGNSRILSADDTVDAAWLRARCDGSGYQI